MVDEGSVGGGDGVVAVDGGGSPKDDDTGAAWAAAKIEQMSPTGDSERCHIGIFSGEACASAGGVYLVSTDLLQCRWAHSMSSMPRGADYERQATGRVRHGKVLHSVRPRPCRGRARVAILCEVCERQGCEHGQTAVCGMSERASSVTSCGTPQS